MNNIDWDIGRKDWDIYYPYLDWSLEYCASNSYMFRMVSNTNNHSCGLGLASCVFSIDPIEGMVDIRDAIFTSEVYIQTPLSINSSEKRWFIGSDGVYYLDYDNIFIMKHKDAVLMMVNEEEIYVSGEVYSSQLFINRNLLKASDINPGYFG